MKLTNAEKQKRYRDNKYKRGEYGDGRINTFVSYETIFAIKRLSRHYKITQRQVIESLIYATDNAIINNLQIDTPEWDKYFDINDERSTHKK
ncbi:hypothetical protein DS509_24970 [Salmonella enterica subsp. diarizonae]|nr:hypothetical protein [Salmonella enterica subsp. diarizonae]EEM0136907.1 hypothetical protein [Salmonella enterica]